MLCTPKQRSGMQIPKATLTLLGVWAVVCRSLQNNMQLVASMTAGKVWKPVFTFQPSDLVSYLSLRRYSTSQCSFAVSPFIASSLCWYICWHAFATGPRQGSLDTSVFIYKS